jgi:glutathionylspermidine amidase/synthetase
MIQTDDTEHSIPQPEIDGELLKISGARLKNTSVRREMAQRK